MSKKLAKKRSKKTKDPKKEGLFKSLSTILKEAGHTVRRERLKVGHGWRVLSGKCRLEESKLVFVDSVMDLDDQIEFLAMKIKEMGYSLPQDLSEQLPAYLR